MQTVYNITSSRPRSDSKQIIIAITTAIIAFLAYSCVYAFRKPFTVATFNGAKYWGISYQTLLIISQVIGYMFSKFYGIKFIAELKRFGRFTTALILVGVSWACLWFFAWMPAPYGMIFLLINGFCLGFLWGIIFSYLEGRKSTDFIGAVMAISFIFAGGFTRSAGSWLMLQFNVTEKWMPFITGLIFAFPLFIFLWLLEKIPPPAAEDVQERMVRVPMNAESRKAFLKKFGGGIILITISYLFLTVMRDIRDNYMSNIWSELGYGSDYSIFIRTETVTSIIVLLMMASLVLVRNNIMALALTHLVIALGLVIAGISSVLFLMGNIEGAIWMQLTSLGLYMGYIPFNCIFFERLIASFRIAGNIGFLMYFADAFGYLGSVGVMLTKEFVGLNIHWSEFYCKGVIVFAALALLATVYSYFYFNKKYHGVAE